MLKTIVELEKKFISVTEGEIRPLSIRDINDSNEFTDVIWSSSDDEIVQIHKFEGIEQGVILNMLKKGSAVVTATSKYGVDECWVEVEPIVSVEDLSKLNYYFGDIHSHTSFSDGQGTPLIACQHAYEGKKADFLAITDHAYTCKKKWLETVISTDSYNDEEFVGIPSYEGGGYGESYVDEYGMNIVNGGEVVYFNTPEILGFHDIVRSKNYTIGMFAHPQEASWPTEFIWNSYNCFNDVNQEARSLIKLVEVVNETSFYNQLHEFSYPLALDKGWHVSPTGVSDTHRGGWTTNYDCRTVILAPELSRAHIYDAMRNNRVYATEDNNTILSFEINGEIMGSTLDAEVSSYEFNISISDPDVNDEGSKIRRIEIISDYGLTIFAQDFNDHKACLKTILQSLTSRYYYIRAVNGKGKKTWSTAIWTGRPFDPIEKDLNRAKKVPKENWKVSYVSSEKANSGKNIFDGDVRVGWETIDASGEIVIDMGREYNLTALGYYRHLIPYEDRNEISKLLSEYELYTSIDGKDFGSSIAKGKIRNYGSETYIHFKPQNARYFKVKALSSLGGNTVAIGEIMAYEE